MSGERKSHAHHHPTAAIVALLTMRWRVTAQADRGWWPRTWFGERDFRLRKLRSWAIAHSEPRP